jgi:ADP-ribose pyrophosphatase
MHKPIPEGKPVFTTPWFQVLCKDIPGTTQSHYSISAPDFSVVIALTPDQRLVLVRQFRHGVGATTLELPAGHVESGDTPEETARKELLEETGYEADRLELLTTLSPSTARFTNRIWCYFAAGVRPKTGTIIEEGMEPVLYDKGLQSLLDEPQFYSAPNFGILCVAILKGKLKISAECRPDK